MKLIWRWPENRKYMHLIEVDGRRAICGEPIERGTQEDACPEHRGCPRCVLIAETRGHEMPPLLRWHGKVFSNAQTAIDL